MPPTRQLVACLALTALVAGGCSGSQEANGPEPTASTPTTGPTSSTTPQADQVRLSVLPPISQPGKQPVASGSAWLATASVTPTSAGSTVLLQRQERDGWRTVARAPVDDAGSAAFPEVAPADGAVTYRAVLVESDGDEQVASEPVEASWQAVFRDEFGGTSLDPSKWDYRQLGVYSPGSRECSTSDESAVSVSGGTLVLHVRRDIDRIGAKCRTADYGTHDYYANGHVSTEGRFSFTYGIAAARVKFQQGRGQHGAFWLQRSGVQIVPGRPDTSGAEIDVAEFFGQGYPEGGLASFVWYRNAGDTDEKIGGIQPDATAQLPKGDAWWRRYHVFSVQWTPDEYVFRVDGRETFRTTKGVSGVDQFLVLSLLTSDWELPKLDTAALPSTMNVDWVRVWQPAAD